MYQLRESDSRSVFEPEPSGTLSISSKNIFFKFMSFVFSRKHIELQLQSSLHHIKDDTQLYVEIHNVHKINK